MIKKKTLPITARGREFSEEERLLFDHAVTIVSALGTPEAMFVSSRKFGELAKANIGPYRIERSIVADGPHARTVSIGIAHEGEKVFEASYELWHRPRRNGELSISTAASTFVRGKWERKFVSIVPASPEVSTPKEASV